MEHGRPENTSGTIDRELFVDQAAQRVPPPPLPEKSVQRTAAQIAVFEMAAEEDVVERNKKAVLGTGCAGNLFYLKDQFRGGTLVGVNAEYPVETGLFDAMQPLLFAVPLVSRKGTEHGTGFRDNPGCGICALRIHDKDFVGPAHAFQAIAENGFFVVRGDDDGNSWHSGRHLLKERRNSTNESMRVEIMEKSHMPRSVLGALAGQAKSVATKTLLALCPPSNCFSPDEDVDLNIVIYMSE